MPIVFIQYFAGLAGLFLGSLALDPVISTWALRHPQSCAFDISISAIATSCPIWNAGCVHRTGSWSARALLGALAGYAGGCLLNLIIWYVAAATSDILLGMLFSIHGGLMWLLGPMLVALTTTIGDRLAR